MKKIFILLIGLISFSFNLNAQCGQTGVDSGVCYVNGSLQAIVVDVCPDLPTETITIDFTAGSKETGFDEIEVYSGSMGSGTGGTQIYNVNSDPSFTGLSFTANAAGECLSIYVNADGSSDCASNGGVSPVYNTTCSTPPPAADCTLPDSVEPICTDQPLTFPGGVNQTAAQTTNPNVNYGCLSSTPNPAWYYLEILTGGTLAFDISNSNTLDVDWAAWGPFTDLAEINTTCASGASPYNATLDCDFTIAPSGTINLGTVTAGQVYAVLVTNFSNTATDISMATTAGSTATTDCSITLDCEVEVDFTTPADMCSGGTINWTAGGLCDVVGPAGSGFVVDLFSYDADGNGIADVGGAPVGYEATADLSSPTHTTGAGPAGTAITDKNPELTDAGFDFTCAAPPTVVAPVNNTCAPYVVTYFLAVFDYTNDTDMDGLCGAGANCLEYSPNCALYRYDVTVYPAPLSVATTDDGTSCGTPAVELRDAAGGTCETISGTDTNGPGASCGADGEQLNYDFSATATATALAAAPAGCALPTLTGTLTCAACSALCGTQDFSVPATACGGTNISVTDNGGCAGYGPVGTGITVDVWAEVSTSATPTPIVFPSASGGADNYSDFAAANPAYTNPGFDFICSDFPLNLGVTNNTCDILYVHWIFVDFDYALDSDADTFAEYRPDCPQTAATTVVYPAPLSVVVTDDGTACGTPTVELRDAAGGTCETIDGTDTNGPGASCGANGEVLNYDFSATGTITALAGAPAGCPAPSSLTGTLTCAACTPGVSIAISDPCNCTNSITILGVEYAQETITITPGVAPYTVTAVTGLYDATGTLYTPATATAAISGTTLIGYVPADNVATHSVTIQDNVGSSDTVNGGPCAPCTAPCAADNGTLSISPN